MNGNKTIWANYFKTVPVNGEPASKCRQGAEALIRRLEDPRYTKTLREELAPLLFPESGDAKACDLREAIQGIATRYGGESRG